MISNTFRNLGKIEKFYNGKVKQFVVENQDTQASIRKFFQSEVKTKLQEALIEHYSKEKICVKISSKLIVLVSKNSANESIPTVQEHVLNAVSLGKTSNIEDIVEQMLSFAKDELEKEFGVESRIEIMKVLALHVTIANSELVEGVQHTHLEDRLEPYHSRSNDNPVPFTIFAAYNKGLKPHIIVFFIHCQFDASLNQYVQYEVKDPNEEDTIKKSLDLLFDCIRDYNTIFWSTKYRQNYFPVYFHSKHNYILEDIVEALGMEDLSVVGKQVENFINVEKLIPTTKGDSKILVRFMNSFNHLPYYQDSLKEAMKSQETQIFDDEFPDSSDLELFNGNIDIIARESRLYKKEGFNSLPVSRKQYVDCEDIMEKYDIKTYEDYRIFFLKLNVIFLADMFQSYRKECIKAFEIDPCYYETLSSFAWDAMMKFTKVQFEDIKDPEMNDLIKDNMRQVLVESVTSEEYDENRETLEKFVMSQSLPFKDFKWITEITKELLKQIVDEAEKKDGGTTGYFLEVDMDSSNPCSPLFPELYIPNMSDIRIPKLYESYNKKTKILINYKHLALGFKNDYILNKVHRIISFTQSTWMKPFVLYNIEKEKSATSSFQKSIFQTMNQAVFGKVNLNQKGNIKFVDEWEDSLPAYMENLSKMRKPLTEKNTQNITTLKKGSNLKRGAKFWITHTNFKRIIPLGRNLAAIEMREDCVVSTKPSYLEFSMSELSKFAMYNSHYNPIVCKFKFQGKKTLDFIQNRPEEYTIKTYYEAINSGKMGDDHCEETTNNKRKILESEEQPMDDKENSSKKVSF